MFDLLIPHDQWRFSAATQNAHREATARPPPAPGPRGLVLRPNSKAGSGDAAGLGAHHHDDAAAIGLRRALPGEAGVRQDLEGASASASERGQTGRYYYS